MSTWLRRKVQHRDLRFMRVVKQDHPALGSALNISIALLFCVCALFTLGLSTVHADDLDDFTQAQDAYMRQDFEDARTRFELLVKKTSQAKQPLLLESRKYLGATYVFLGHEDLARTEFEALLRDEPTYQLNPAEFPQKIYRIFQREKRLIAELMTHQENEQRLQRELEAANKRSSETHGADSNVRVRENSRLVALLPFGIGQYQNGSKNLGLFFAISEGILAAASIGLFIAHQHVLSQDPGPFVGAPPGEDTQSAVLSDKQRRFRDSEEALRIVNWAVLGTLAATMIVGALEAQLSFVPEIRIDNDDQAAILHFQHAF